MNVYPIPETLAGAYHGCGYALAAIVDGRVVDMLYFRDVLPGFSDEDANGNGIHPESLPIADHRLAPTIAHLSGLGEVSVGMVSCWELCEI